VWFSFLVLAVGKNLEFINQLIKIAHSIVTAHALVA